MRVYFVPSSLVFIPAAWKADGTYADSNWPNDAVLLTEEQALPFWKQSPPEGKVLGSLSGLPCWVDRPPVPPLTSEQAQRLRLAAYRAESDPLKFEAEYDALIAGTAPDYTLWMAKVAEIKQRHHSPL